MKKAYINVQSLSTPAEDWVSYFYDAQAPISLTVTGWTFEWIANPATENTGTLGPLTAGTGDLSWAVATSLRQGARTGTQAVGLFAGLDPTKEHRIVATGSFPSSGRSLNFSVNGGDIQVVPTDNGAGSANTTAAAQFDNVFPNALGEITLEFSNGTGSTGDGYATCFGIEEIVATTANVTVDDSAFEPGKAITGTYASYASAPTVVTLTDSAGNTLTPAVTINDTAKTFSTAYPARITTGTATTLLRGPVTVELT